MEKLKNTGRAIGFVYKTRDDTRLTCIGDYRFCIENRRPIIMCTPGGNVVHFAVEGNYNDNPAIEHPLDIIEGED